MRQPSNRFSAKAAARVAATAILLLSAMAVLGNPASARAIETEELINFSTGDPATDPGTEGIDIDAEGNIYISANSGAGGQIWKIAPGATEPEVLATLIPPTGGAGFGVLGVHIEGDHLLAAAHTLADPELNGVWFVDLATGEASHIAGTEVIGLPNDLTVWDGAIYVTDSVAGAVWRVTAGATEPWLVDPLLAGTGALVPGLPLGANGIDVYNGRFYVANLEGGSVISVYINSRGEAVAPRLFNTVDGFPDGLAVDRQGQPHVVLIDSNALVRVGRRANLALVDDAEILDSPASLAFGPRRQNQEIYVVNFSIAEGFPDLLEQSEVGPGVVAVR